MHRCGQRTRRQYHRCSLLKVQWFGRHPIRINQAKKTQMDILARFLATFDSDKLPLRRRGRYPYRVLFVYSLVVWFTHTVLHPTEILIPQITHIWTLKYVKLASGWRRVEEEFELVPQDCRSRVSVGIAMTFPIKASLAEMPKCRENTRGLFLSSLVPVDRWCDFISSSSRCQHHTQPVKRGQSTILMLYYICQISAYKSRQRKP